MSESTPEPSAGGGRRILGMKPMTAYLVFGGALAVGIIAYLIKVHQQTSSASSGTTAATTTGTAAEGIDYSGELSTIQTELEALLQQDGVTTGGGSTSGNGGGWSGGWGDSGGSTGTGSGSGSSGSSGSGSGSGSGTNGAGTGTTTTTGTGTSTGTGTTTAAKATAPTGGRTVSVSNNGAVIAWNANGATQWTVKITGPGAINGKTSTVTKPQATYSGLEAGHDYEVTVTPTQPNTAPSGVITFKTT